MLQMSSVTQQAHAKRTVQVGWAATQAQGLIPRKGKTWFTGGCETSMDQRTPGLKGHFEQGKKQ